MNAGPEQVDQIVREVLRSLAGGDAARAGGTSAPCGCADPGKKCRCSEKKGHVDSAAASADVKGAAAAPGEWWLEERVVTIEHLSGRLEGVRTLLLPPRAVVTPAAKDLLRAQGIALGTGLGERQQRAGASGSTNAEVVTAPAERPANVSRNARREWAVVTTETRYCPQALIAAAVRQKVAVRRLASAPLLAAVGELVLETSGGDALGLCLTDAPAAAACLANRATKVRALWLRSPADVQDAQSIGMNLAIVRPREWAFFALLSVVRRLATGEAAAAQWRAAIDGVESAPQTKTFN